MYPSLIQFNRCSLILMPADIGEKMSDVGFGLLRIAFGKTFEVTQISDKDSPKFQEVERSLFARISAIVCAILIFPVTAVLAGIGCIGIGWSASHAELHAKYLDQLNVSQQKLDTEIKNNNEEETIINPPLKTEDCSNPTFTDKSLENPFTCKFSRADSLDLNGVFGKPRVLATLEHLQKDAMIKEVIEQWYNVEKGKSNQKDLSLVDVMTGYLKGGTCYGQAMNILELLGSKKVNEISEEYIANNMTWQHYAYYQIVHILHVFILNCHSAYAYGLSVKEATEKLESVFPHYKKRGHSTEKMNLKDLQPDILVGNFSDFIKMYVRGNESDGLKHDYAVQVGLNGAASGHAGIIYYSETQERYFWYDPYLPDYGLFSTNDYKNFFKGVANKLLEYKERPDFTHLKFTAYQL